MGERGWRIVERRRRKPFRDEMFEPMEPTKQTSPQVFLLKVTGKMRNW